MNANTLIASLPGVQLSVADWLASLKRQGQLAALVGDALIRQLLREEAQQRGLAVTDRELQAAADAYRRRHQLHGAEQTRHWLSRNGLTLDDFEQSLEEVLLTARLKEHVAEGQVEAHFQAHQADYERLDLVRLTAPRDDLARELASQVRDDGRPLEVLAREHRLALHQGLCYRQDLPSTLTTTLAEAGSGELVGPVSTPQGFVLIRVDERRPPTLDDATRQHIVNELFGAWLTERMKGARIDLKFAGAPG